MLGTVNCPNAKILIPAPENAKSDKLEDPQKNQNNQSKTLIDGQAPTEVSGNNPEQDVESQSKKTIQKPDKIGFKSFLINKIKEYEPSNSDKPEEVENLKEITIRPIFIENVDQIDPEINVQTPVVAVDAVDNAKIETQPNPFVLNAENNTIVPSDALVPQEKADENLQQPQLEVVKQTLTPLEAPLEKKPVLDSIVEPRKNRSDDLTEVKENPRSDQTQMVTNDKVKLIDRVKTIANDNKGNDQLIPEYKSENSEKHVETGDSPSDKSLFSKPIANHTPDMIKKADKLCELSESEPGKSQQFTPNKQLSPLVSEEADHQSEQSEVSKPEELPSGQNELPKGFEIRNFVSTEHTVEPADRASISATQTPSRTGIHSASPHSSEIVRPIDQILDHISSMSVSQDQHRVRLSLSPQYLGAVRMTFQYEGDEVFGLLEVQKTETRREIEETLPHLISSMQSSGLQVRRVEVVQWDSNQQAFKDESSAGFDSSMKQEFFQESSGQSSGTGFSERNRLSDSNTGVSADEINRHEDHQQQIEGQKGLNMLV